MNKIIRPFVTLLFLTLSPTIFAQGYVTRSTFIPDPVYMDEEDEVDKAQLIEALKEVENTIDKDTVCKDLDYLREIDPKFDLDYLASIYLDTFLDCEDNAIYKAKDLSLFRKNESSEWELCVSKEQLSSDSVDINNTYEKVKEYIASKKMDGIYAKP